MEKQPYTILCAIDFSKYSSQLVRFAARLADRLSAHLVVFHSVCFPRSASQDTPTSEQMQDGEEGAARARVTIDELMADQKLPWRAEIRIGEPVDALKEFVKEQAVDLVLTASYGLSGWKRLLLGTVVEQMAQTLPVPMLVVNPSRHTGTSPSLEEWQPADIQVCCDLTTPADPLYRWAVALAHPFDASLHCVHALEKPIDVGVVDPTTAPYEEVQQTLLERLHHRLVDQLPESMQTGRRVSTDIVPGEAGAQMVAYAKKHQVDLIIVGVKQRRSLHKRLVGSTTESALRQSPCPVLVVPIENPQNGQR